MKKKIIVFVLLFLGLAFTVSENWEHIKPVLSIAKPETKIVSGVIEKMQVRESHNYRYSSDYYIVVNETRIQIPYDVWRTLQAGDKVDCVYTDYVIGDYHEAVSIAKSME